MIILLDVRLTVWAGPVMFYANSLFTPCKNKVLYNLYQAPKSRFRSCQLLVMIDTYTLASMLKNDVSNVGVYNVVY